jgi:hypothetical protein
MQRIEAQFTLLSCQVAIGGRSRRQASAEKGIDVEQTSTRRAEISPTPHTDHSRDHSEPDNLPSGRTSHIERCQVSGSNRQPDQIWHARGPEFESP